MILQQVRPDDLAGFDPDVVVVGGGPIGLITALDLETRGLRTLVLESSGTAPNPAAQALSAAEIVNPDTHHVGEIAVARQLGGTSNLWGGRCVPFDPIDFERRPWMGDSTWPIGPQELGPYLAPACRMLGVGEAVFADPAPVFSNLDPAFAAHRLERWSNQPRIHRLHGPHLRQSLSLLIALHVTVTGFEWKADPEGRERISALKLALTSDPGAVERARLDLRGASVPVILAAGGNESTRLLLAEQRAAPARFGGEDGPLGRFYQGHVNGQIADVLLAGKAAEAALDFYVDAHDSYVRRRFVPSDTLQREMRLPNIAFWPVVPEVSKVRHRSGPLSLAFLALSFPALGRRMVAESIRLKHVGVPPHRRLPHALNILRDPFRTLGFVPWFLWNRKCARHRLPGLFVRNGASRYGLEFHAEQRADPDSRLTLTGTADRLGLPRLRIDYRFHPEDAQGVVRAHDAFEAWLTRTGLGRLVYRMDRAALAESVLLKARHGNHQIGTLRMAASPEQGVVDPDCRVFGCENLYVASTAVLPTSSQASPTLITAQLGLRLAEHLALSAATKIAP